MRKLYTINHHLLTFQNYFCFCRTAKDGRLYFGKLYKKKYFSGTLVQLVKFYFWGLIKIMTVNFGRLSYKQNLDSQCSYLQLCRYWLLNRAIPSKQTLTVTVFR